MQFHVCVTFKQGDRISFFMWDCEAFFYPVFPCLTSWDIVPNINWLCRTYPFSIVCACAVKAINVSLSNTKLPMEIYKSPKKKKKKIKNRNHKLCRILVNMMETTIKKWRGSECCIHCRNCWSFSFAQKKTWPDVMQYLCHKLAREFETLHLTFTR